MAAEGLPARDGGQCDVGVNGAAAGWPRKVGRGGCLPSGGLQRQWGRGRMAAEGALADRIGG